MTNVWNGKTSVTTYPFGPYVYYQQSWPDFLVKHGYNPSNSTCDYDTTVPLYQPDWCAGYWSNAVRCDPSYSITSLAISGNSWTKTAKIPTAIGALTSLQSLELNNMGLSGPIPGLLGGLSRLTYLDLQRNMLTGSVPAFVTSVSLWSTPTLDNNCNLTSSIPALSNQMNNGRVSICSDDRTTIAAEGQAICKIAHAWSSVRISVYNGNSYVPKPVFSNSYGGDTSLRYGYNPANSTCYYNTSMPLHQPAWCNYWSGISCSNGKVTSLSISGNSFSSSGDSGFFWTNTAKLPTAIGALTNLQSLYLTNMGLTGSIPNFMSLSRLKYLYLYNNMLTGVIPKFVNRTISNGGDAALYSNCNLTSPVPRIAKSLYSQGTSCQSDVMTIAAEGQAICKIARAWSSVRISVYNGYTYVLKPVFSNSKGGDTSLRYGYNPANSTCYYNTSMPLHQPDWCSNWSGISCTNNKVTSLAIYGNSFSNSGPSGSFWTNTAKLPTAIGALTNLQSLSLTNMGLTGSIPNLMSLSRLTYLSLSNNMLTGVVPKFVNHTVFLSNYKYYLPNNIHLSSNCNLTSSVPRIAQSIYSQGSSCQSDVTTIAAEGQAICKIARAWSSVRLYVNGFLKPVFSNSKGGDTSLRYGYNPANSTCYYNTSMPLHQPDWCNYWSGISCSNNKVYSLNIQGFSWTNTAKLPTAIGALTYLQSLSLTYMGLTGSIPNFMSLSRLNSLSLTNNMLTGVVPQFVNQTVYLSNNKYYLPNSIQLSGNCNLTSPIPRVATRLTNQGGQYCKPSVAAITAEGQAMCAIAQAWSNMQVSRYTGHNYTMTNVFGSFSSTSTGLKRTGYVPGKSTCSYYTNGTHTSSLLSYQPVWCSWPGVSCINNQVNMLLIQSPSWTKTSKIPIGIGALTNLQYLSLSYAGLSGSIPNFVGLSKLTSLNLDNNRLTGDVPAFINTMTTKPSTRVSLQSNCNLTWTSTSPMGINSNAYYQPQGNCAPLKPGQLLSLSHLFGRPFSLFLF